MKNRMRKSCTFGSVRGEDGAAMVTLLGHAAGNGGYGQGDAYGRDRASPTRRYPANRDVKVQALGSQETAPFSASF